LAAVGYCAAKGRAIFLLASSVATKRVTIEAATTPPAVTRFSRLTNDLILNGFIFRIEPFRTLNLRPTTMMRLDRRLRRLRRRRLVRARVDLRVRRVRRRVERTAPFFRRLRLRDDFFRAIDVPLGLDFLAAVLRFRFAALRICLAAFLTARLTLRYLAVASFLILFSKREVEAEGGLSKTICLITCITFNYSDFVNIFFCLFLSLMFFGKSHSVLVIFTYPRLARNSSHFLCIIANSSPKGRRGGT